MRKMILFGVIFFLVDRFMHYKLTHNSVKARVIAITKEPVSKALLSERKDMPTSFNKKTLLVHNKRAYYLPHTSNRNV